MYIHIHICIESLAVGIKLGELVILFRKNKHSLAVNLNKTLWKNLNI